MTDIDLTAAKDEAARRWPSKNIRDPLPSDWLNEGMASGFVLGAQWALAQVEARVKPSREDVARVIESDAWTLSDDDYFKAYDDGMRGVGYCLQMRSGRRKASLKRADAVLALLPGRTETEVREQVAQELLSDASGRPFPHAYVRLMNPLKGEHPVRTFRAAVEILARGIARGGEQA